MVSGAIPSHSGSAWCGASPSARLRRKTMSVTTAVPSRLKASDGRRMAPTKSALSPRNSRKSNRRRRGLVELHLFAGRDVETLPVDDGIIGGLIDRGAGPLRADRRTAARYYTAGRQ